MADAISPAVPFDPVSGMVRATAAFLHGKAFPRLGPPPGPGPLGQAVRLLPRLLGPKILAGPERRGEDDPEKAAEAETEAIARWVAEHYPRRRYPAVAMGWANGALVHLCAALGIPWLPHSFLVPAREAPRVVEPEDRRPVVRSLTHYRVTRRQLGAAYKAFLTRCLDSGGTILMADCAQSRAAVGSEEAMPALVEDLPDFARRRGLALVRLAFSAADDLTPLVADLYSWWYRRRKMLARRLLATSSIVSDPMWTLRLAAVPFWLESISEAAAASLEHYLEMRPPFDYVNLCLFHAGAPTEDLPPVERWQGILARAKRRGEFVGVDAASYPADLSSFTRYQAAIKRIPARFPVPPSLPLADFGGFLRYARRYKVAVEPVDGAVRWLT